MLRKKYRVEFRDHFQWKVHSDFINIWKYIFLHNLHICRDSFPSLANAMYVIMFTDLREIRIFLRNCYSSYGMCTICRAYAFRNMTTKFTQFQWIFFMSVNKTGICVVVVYTEYRNKMFLFIYSHIQEKYLKYFFFKKDFVRVILILIVYSVPWMHGATNEALQIRKKWAIYLSIKLFIWQIIKGKYWRVKNGNCFFVYYLLK